MGRQTDHSFTGTLLGHQTTVIDLIFCQCYFGFYFYFFFASDTWRSPNGMQLYFGTKCDTNNLKTML